VKAEQENGVNSSFRFDFFISKFFLVSSILHFLPMFFKMENQIYKTALFDGNVHFLCLLLFLILQIAFVFFAAARRDIIFSKVFLKQNKNMTTTDFLTGTVKGPGELPHEYLFITKDNRRKRIGEFVYL